MTNINQILISQYNGTFLKLSFYVATSDFYTKGLFQIMKKFLLWVQHLLQKDIFTHLNQLLFCGSVWHILSVAATSPSIPYWDKLVLTLVELHQSQRNSGFGSSCCWTCLIRYTCTWTWTCTQMSWFSILLVSLSLFLQPICNFCFLFLNCPASCFF